ncbi:hypothetical protein EGW08_014209 [Elysia chlorotica]|uniref:G-protein coupled receptors family 2 profile 2 domain-containing protein n=1 Tax=Elysia chlorotica TaxID=188477 RepID=A0A3S1B7R9_ELYCH|nr:hypothetical protein EGW08_014209 [Elysia chlorotica]
MKLATFVDHLSGYPHIGYTPLVVLGETNSSSFCSDPGVRCHKSEGSDYAAIWPSSFTARDHFINAGQNLSCECVQFNSSDYEIEKTDRTTSFIPVIKLSLNLGKITLVFTEWTELSSMSFIAKTRDQSGFSAVEKAQYALTLVCVGVSMVCLALTLLTYLSFRALRNEAGLNNTFLCASMLMAQAFLVASSHVSGPGPVCTALGLVTHFLWLWLFAWSWLCCLHMYRVFSLTTGGHHIRTHRRGCCSWLDSRLVRTVALSLTLPVGVVCAVTVASLGASGGSRTGYGRDACYLDTPLLVGLGTVLPLCAVIASNAVFFTITACKIRHTRALQSRDFSRSKQSDRTDLFIYIKLSSITGVFWLVQIMAEALDNDVLRFLAIITNGLQGVFIFLSYTCNTRVLGLYRRGLGVRDTTLTSLDSQKKATGQDVKQSSISLSSTERSANNSSVNTDC